MKKYLIYKIVNKINNMIYIGCHVTTNINDSYMGSGTNIKKAIKQYGLENFDKYILCQFDNEIDMLNKEEELVNREFIAEENNYNIIVGGRQFLTLDTLTVKDKDGNCFRVHKTDKRYLSGELISVAKGYVSVRDINNNILYVEYDNEKYLSGELVSTAKDYVFVKDNDNNRFCVLITDERYLSGELVSAFKNHLLVKDKNGNNFFVCKTDERYISGNLVPYWKNKKHTDESKKKIGIANSIKQKGESNSRFGTCWIKKEGLSKSINKELLDQYIKQGWEKGRVMSKN